ncbi:hypothetical protein BKA93DRAFT_917435 [Sparassis latifolia]|uniref:Uncharacterized protein n=1 Tax=Sparassis crispa TaxID=139825 RepID=A0A401H3R7_9APHY|nr:hypothetical protein SCP_1500800 [Sparassis crispa]GBE89077.1 hypothetical protein SCP_1500800 [Sparassis crispa]
MSVSPPIRRLSSASSSSREDLINQYEAEEERIINVLSRKLEQLREEKIELENALEAESESHVNRLSREISALRLAQQHPPVNGSGGGEVTSHSLPNPAEPSAEIMLDAMRRENEQLRNRLVDTERDYIRITRLNEIYREELIEHRRRLGLPVDNLIGLSSMDPYSQPTHRRSGSSASSPSTSVLVLPSPQITRHVSGVPIPRPSSQVPRPGNNFSSESTTPFSHSPSSSSSSPFPISPLPASYLSMTTNVTTPPSSASLTNPAVPFPGSVGRGLSYPSVPPPSLSSSFGSPSTSYHTVYPISFARPSQERDTTPSPVDSFSSRRNSFHRRGSFERRIAETGSLRSASRGQSHSRRASVERGARVAETGSLIPRGLPEGDSLIETAEDAEVVAQENIPAGDESKPEAIKVVEGDEKAVPQASS